MSEVPPKSLRIVFVSIELVSSTAIEFISFKKKKGDCSLISVDGFI
jgi:hypothetical protein